MSALWPILGMAAGVYALRLAGLALRDLALPPGWERALRLLPVALLTALIVLNLTGQAEGSTSRLAAAAGAGLVAYRTGRMWACILSGMVLYWLLRLI